MKKRKRTGPAWPNVGMAHARKRPMAREPACWHFYKRDLILAPNYVTVFSLFLSLSDLCT